MTLTLVLTENKEAALKAKRRRKACRPTSTCSKWWIAIYRSR
jgi:hypothetical protein